MSLLVKLDLAPTSEPTHSKASADRLISGDPSFKTWAQEESRNGTVHAGVWEATPGETRSIKEEAMEFCYILSGVVGLTLPAARDLAPHGIRVNTVAPGVVDTPMLAGVGDEVKARLAADVPFPRRLGSPDEFAELVLFLVEHDYMNGETVRMDGALRMGAR